MAPFISHFQNRKLHNRRRVDEELPAAGGGEEGGASEKVYHLSLASQTTVVITNTVNRLKTIKLLVKHVVCQQNCLKILPRAENIAQS